jgi:hypothetical protein
MSPVQTMALEMLMMVEQIDAGRKIRETRRLALVDKDPDKVRAWFPDWFPPEQVGVDSEAAADRLVEHAMGGGEVLWEADDNAPAPTPEEVEALMRQFAAGSGSLADLGDRDQGWE